MAQFIGSVNNSFTPYFKKKSPHVRETFQDKNIIFTLYTCQIYYV